MTGSRSRALAAAAAAAAAALAFAAPAGAAVPPSLHAPGNCTELEPAPGLVAHHCDDGTPAIGGGLVPNLTGASAVTVPAKYGGDGYRGLPPKAADAASMPGANPLDGTIALDVNVTLPGTRPPDGGYPLLVFMHGCCGGRKSSHEQTTIDAGGEAWHYSNAWFAARGYVVITYTSRGFVNNLNQGSSGQAQLQSRSFEINDYQHLACQVLATAPEFGAVTGHDVAINPEKVVVTGGSYGGGFAWLALTDPRWTCTADTGAQGAEMGLAAAAPKYGWTDLAYTLVPNGLHSQLPGELPATDGCDTGPHTLAGAPCPAPANPLGMAKTSIVAGLFVTGNLVTGDHTTFTPEITEAFACLAAPSPAEVSPLCANVIGEILPEFMRERSAYYQHEFFERIAADPGWRVPVFNAAALTDPLFPAYEHRRMLNRLLDAAPGYPIRSVFGDYEHFTQNKAKEWGDICDTGDGRGRRVCEFSDYPGGDLDAEPDGLVRTGITTQLSRFLDHYARPAGNPDEPEPDFDVSASLQVCPQNAGPAQPADEPGPLLSAPTFEEIAPHTLEIEHHASQTTLSRAVPNPHASSADPVLNQQLNGSRCPVETEPAGPGVATYDGEPLASETTMVGSGEVTVSFELLGPAEGLQLNARLYDLLPDGRAVMVDRGTRRMTPAEASAGEVSFGLHGNGWRFPEGHRVRIELAQDDFPFVRFTDIPSSLVISGVRLELPIREPHLDGPPPAPPDDPDPDSRPGDTLAGRCANLIVGTNGPDRLVGTPRGDRIRGRGGDDVLLGRAGADCLHGGRGNDLLRGGSGADVLRGGPGNDRLFAGRGADRIFGGPGNDRIVATRGRNRVDCGRGRDVVIANRQTRVAANCNRVIRR